MVIKQDIKLINEILVVTVNILSISFDSLSEIINSNKNRSDQKTKAEDTKSQVKRVCMILVFLKFKQIYKIK